MTTTINASTSSGLVVTPDNSGNVMLQYNGISTPAFSASKVAAVQNVTSGTPTKITFENEEFDTANCYDPSTSKFTPTVAGYYLITICMDVNANSGTLTRDIPYLYKNGAASKILSGLWTVTGTEVQVGSSVLVQANGTTDYFEVYYLSTGTTPQVQNDSGGKNTYFQGYLVRGA